MAIDSNKIVTFVDLDWLVQNEGFLKKNIFDINSLKCVNKTEVQDSLFLAFNSELNSFSSNRDIPRRVLYPTENSFVCTANDVTTPTPDEVGVTTPWSTTNVTKSTGVAVDGVASLVVISTINTVIVAKASKQYPLVNTRNYIISFYAKIGSGIHQRVEIYGAGFSSIFSSIPSSFTYYEISGTATSNTYLTFDAIAKDLHTGNIGDTISIDKILIQEYPVNLYPVNNGASIGVDEANSVLPWIKYTGTESETILQTMSPGNSSSYGIRVLVTTAETFLVSAGAIFSFDVKDGRDIEISFDANIFIASSGGAVFEARQAVYDYLFTSFIADGTWHSYTVTVSPTDWDLLSIIISINGHDGDYIQFDNMRITQLPCV